MQLRYRLMPYLYSLAAKVYFDDYTLMRGLPMDYPEDPEVRDLSDQWMLGPAFMPCPVYEYEARSREVYFPEGGWYDFYTGEYIQGGRRLTVDAPYERMPLYVREGSIVPIGPAIEWTGDNSQSHITFRVYAGKDADFTLYEDDGTTYAYEKGQYSTIEVHWHDASHTFTIDARKGSFPGMSPRRTFCVTVIDPENPRAFDPDNDQTICITYEGHPATFGL